jgi:photosystem II stability/assembly factor-like uncharacterized protein
MRKNKLIIASLLIALPLIGAGCTSGSKDAGILRSLDGAKSFEFKNAIEGGGSFESKNVLRITFNPSNTKQIIVGTQGDGFYFTENQGDSWKNVAFSNGNGNAIAIDSTDQNIIYLALDTKIYRSDDGGKNFHEVYTEQTGIVSDVVIDPTNHLRIFGITSSGNFIVSLDAGETWKSTAFIVGVPYRLELDPRNVNHVYVATQENGVFTSVDGGLHFNNDAFTVMQNTLESNSSEVMVTNDVSIDPFDSNIVFVATAYGLVKSSDAGKTFAIMPTLIIPESVPLRTVEFHPTIKNVLFLTAANKFYTSTDLGSTWSVVELATSREVYDVAISPSNPNELYLAIKGEGKNTQPVDLIRFGTK